MISDTYKIRPRYSETDQMGYIYHGNYVSYCHQARTELLRGMGLHDKFLEENNVILPVIEMNMRYLKPAFYDQEITIITTMNEKPRTRLKFNFEIINDQGVKISQCYSEVVFVDSQSRKPIRIPDFVSEQIDKYIRENKGISNG